MNDVALISSDTLCLFEQQSTWNKNMPLRYLVYASREYEKYILMNELNTYSTRQIMLPTSKFICFYNGTKEHGAKEILKLSSAFRGKGDLEATVTVYNLNVDQPELKSCKALMEYGWFVSKVTEYNKEKYDTLEVAINKALDEIPEDFILRNLLLEERGELMSILKTEFNQEEFGQAMHDDGYAEGKEDGVKEGLATGIEKGKEIGLMEGKIETIKNLLDAKQSLDLISIAVKIPVEELKEIIKNNF